MSRSYSRLELFFAKRNLFREISAQQGKVFRLAVALQRDVHRQHRRKSRDVVVPEGALNLREISFVQECAIARRLQIDPANFHIQSIFLGSYYQVRADGPQFAIDLVADIGRDPNHGSGDCDAQSDGRASQQFTTLLATEG